MPARNDLIAIPDEVLRDGSIGQAVLVFMDFRDGPKRWWTGFGDLDVGGHRWQGVGDLVSIGKISTAYQVSAKQVTFKVAATPEMFALALNAKARVRDRAVTVYLQLFSNIRQAAFTAGGGELMAGDPVGSPISLFNGTMQRMPWSAEGPAKREISIEAEGLFFRRNAPPRGRWTDADQQAFFAGDRAFERLPLYANGYEVGWRNSG